MRISDWSSDVCSSDLVGEEMVGGVAEEVTGTVCEVPAIDLLHLLQPLAPGLGESCELVTGRVGHACSLVVAGRPRPAPSRWMARRARGKIGSASCRERVCQDVWISAGD